MRGKDYRFGTKRNSFTKTQTCPDTMSGRFWSGIVNDWPPSLDWSQHQRRPVQLRPIEQGDP
jgi:hypothetical protein